MILHCAPAPGRSASRSGQLADRGKVEFYAFDILFSDGEDVRKLPRAPPAYQMRSKGEAPAFETRATEQETRASLAARRVGNAPPAKPTLDAHDRSWLHCSS